MRLKLCLAALALALALPAQAQRFEKQPSRFCEPLAQIEGLRQLSGDEWLSGGSVWMKEDILVCAWYRTDEAPQTFSFRLRNDQGNHYANSQKRYASRSQPAPEWGEQAFYYRADPGEPFAPYWGLVARVKGRLYRVEGVPEGADPQGAQAARGYAAAVLRRMLNKFEKP